MLEPVTTFITLATFIKDLIELGEGIRSSIEKVGENRRQIRELTQDVARTLYDLASSTRGKEDALLEPELLSALENLKAEMLHIHAECIRNTQIRFSGLRAIGSQFTAWRKRDDLGKKIARLREHVNKCYLQFTAVSAARTEYVASEIAHTTLRMEQRMIVDNVESQVKARRLEALMARLLLESDFGQHKLAQTVEIISDSLESQYLSAQLQSLVTSLEQLVACDNLSLQSSLFDSEEVVYVFKSTPSSSHILYQILGTVLEVNGGADVLSLGSLIGDSSDMYELDFGLRQIGKHSDAIAWGHLRIHLLHYAAEKGYGFGILPQVADALCGISYAHRSRFEFDSAVIFSQKSLHLWLHLSESLPEANNRIGPLCSMVCLAQNLLKAEENMTALSAAQDAVSFAQSMVEDLIESSFLTAPQECEAVTCCDAFLVLARIQSSLNRSLDSYKAFVEGFQISCRLAVPGQPPAGEDIDCFIDTISREAEEGRLSLPMLAECVSLFRDLASIYPPEFSCQFLYLLHAYTYFSQQDCGTLCMDTMRRFLEPTSASPPPALDFTRPMQLQPSMLEETLRFFCNVAWAAWSNVVPLMQNILVAHFLPAMDALHAVTHEPVFNMLSLYAILNITRVAFLFLSEAEHAVLLRVVAGAVGHFRASAVPLDPTWEPLFVRPLYDLCVLCLRTGLLDEGFAFCSSVVAYLQTQVSAVTAADPWQKKIERLQIFTLFEAARLSAAIGCAQQTMVMPFNEEDDIEFFLSCIDRTRILRRIGRHSEALHVVNRAIKTVSPVYWKDGRTVDLSLFLTELTLIWSGLEQPQKALVNAERVVAACEEVNIGDADEELLCVQIHSWIILSNCLAALGRQEKALETAQIAVSSYTQNAEKMWEDFLFMIRKQELGGNAYFALSLRLAASGESEQALLSGQHAISLYRQLVALAPRHLPTLASSLRHQASILWTLVRPHDAIAACEEAVDILRKVVDTEAYFLPALADTLDDLGGYLIQMHDVSGASAATIESAEDRRKFAFLPPEPKWIFEDFEELENSDDALNWWEWEPRNALGNVAIEGNVEERLSEEDECQNASRFQGSGDAVTVPPLPTAIVDAPASSMKPDPELGVEGEATQTAVTVIVKAQTDTSPSKAPSTSALVLCGVVLGALIAVAGNNMAGTDAFSHLVEIRLSMRSTPVDILWWILLAVLFAVMYNRII
ncbi:Tetratricopeptide repeat family [Favolaschia claudopus]|uniref:Tetratricopeptide repeat family n=1 Tax=Favolaschia claudopus TaxID=2862362 RepID=A0AAW0A4Y5_9AGAR